MPPPLVTSDFISIEAYREAVLNQPVLWKLQEPLDTREVVAHAAKIPLNDLEVVTLRFRSCKLSSADLETVSDEEDTMKATDVDDRRKISIYECAILHPSATRAVQDWYLRQGLWPFSGKRVMWGARNSLLLVGYPQHAKELAAGQVNIERALTAFRIESGSDEQ